MPRRVKPASDQPLDFKADMLKSMREERMKNDICYAFTQIASPKLYDYQRRFLLDNTRLKVVLKSRQTGMSFCASFKMFWQAWTGRKESQILVSVSARAARTVMNYIKEFARKLDFNDKNCPAWNNEMIQFPNNCAVYCLPQSPGTIRSLHGDVMLDECAHFEKGEEIKEAVLPFLSRGYGLTAISTPRGYDPLFYMTFWQSEHYTKYAIPWNECPDLTVENLKPVWDTMDQDSIEQEYNCKFLDEAHAFFPWNLLMSRVDSSLETSEHPTTDLRWMGVDIGRKKDATVFIGLDKNGRVILLKTFKNTPFDVQLDYARMVIPYCTRASMDYTGLGMNMVETLEQEFGSKIEKVIFTNDIKEQMMTELHIAFEPTRDPPHVTIPNDRDLLRQIHAIKKSPITSGVKFDVDRDEDHHGDMAWSLALAWRAGFLKYRPTMRNIQNPMLDSLFERRNQERRRKLY
jgi:phage FluMu gp28-like protein